MSERRGVIERLECARCGAEVRVGKRRHFCGPPYPLRACEEIVTVRYVEVGRTARLNQKRKAMSDDQREQS